MEENIDNSPEITIDVNAKLVTDINNNKDNTTDNTRKFKATIKLQPESDITCVFNINNLTDSNILAAWTDLLNTCGKISEVITLYNALKSNQPPTSGGPTEPIQESHQRVDELDIKNFKYNAMQDRDGNFTGKIIPNTNIEEGKK